jgi:hypothetical protein
MSLASDAYELNKRAFQEMLERDGVPITSNSGVQRMCITDAIKTESALEIVGQVLQSSVRVAMLAEDFAAFEPLTLNLTTVTINLSLATLNLAAVLPDLTVRILRIDRDPLDPTVTFYAVGVH